MRAAQPREVVLDVGHRGADLFQGEASSKITLDLPEGELLEVGDAGVSIPTLAIVVGVGHSEGMDTVGELEVQRRRLQLPHPDLFSDFVFFLFAL